MNITVINQILTEEQNAIINKAIETLTPIYEKAINRPIQQSEIDRLHWAYSGCFIENRGGEEELNEILNANIRYWSNYKQKPNKENNYAREENP